MSSESGYSDDSDYENLYSYHTTSVSLAFADKKVSASEKCSVLSNRIGGSPIWLSGNSVPSPELRQCLSCKQELTLLAQISAPLENTYYDRVLYVLTCLEPSCRRKEGSVRAIRGIKRDKEKERLQREKEEEEKRVKQKQELENRRKNEAKLKKLGEIGDQLTYGASSQNPFGGDPFGEKPFWGKVSDSITPETIDKAEKVGKATGKPPAYVDYSALAYGSKNEFPSYLLQVESEQLTPREQPLDNIHVGIEEPGEEDDTRCPSSSNVEDSDSLAKQLNAANVDKAFQHFVDIVDNNPEQVMRYDRPLKPLLYSSSDKVAKIFSQTPAAIPKCSITNGPRILELQLVPHAIAVLEDGNEDIERGMEWGAIFVATSKEDGMPQLNAEGIGYTEEWVGVQWEEEIDECMYKK